MEIPTNQFRKGLKVDIEDHPYEIVDFQHVSPGKGRAFTRTKLKSLLTSNVIERTITSGDKLKKADTDDLTMQYLYSDLEGFHFMDTSNYEQIAIESEVVGKTKDYLKENIEVNILKYNGRPIGISLPNFVELKVTQCDPAFKGDTVQGSTKPAALETGANIQVPYHIKEGDMIRVDTRSDEYVEKVNK